MQNSISQYIKELAANIGFDACGLARADILNDEMEMYKRWLESGYEAEMNYAHNYLDIRENIQLLQDNTKTVLVTLSNYYPQKLQNSSLPRIAKYAYGRDYHKVLLRMHQLLLKLINDKIECNGRIFVDSAPVLERSWAQRAGLGFIGKNGMLISPTIGVHTLISGIALDIEMEQYDEPMHRSCGRCGLCIDNCPANAIVKPKVIDSNKCLSYLTIEHRGDFKTGTSLGNRIFGCDACIDICPYNKKQANSLSDFAFVDARMTLTLEDWRNLSEEQFNSLFNGTSVKRAKYSGIMRNLKNL